MSLSVAHCDEQQRKIRQRGAGAAQRDRGIVGIRPIGACVTSRRVTQDAERDRVTVWVVASNNTSARAASSASSSGTHIAVSADDARQWLGARGLTTTSRSIIASSSAST